MLIHFKLSYDFEGRGERVGTVLVFSHLHHYMIGMVGHVFQGPLRVNSHLLPCPLI